MKFNKFKKLLSSVLALGMVLGTMPAQALAAPAEQAAGQVYSIPYVNWKDYDKTLDGFHVDNNAAVGLYGNARVETVGSQYKVTLRARLGNGLYYVNVIDPAQINSENQNSFYTLTGTKGWLTPEFMEKYGADRGATPENDKYYLDRTVTIDPVTNEADITLTVDDITKDFYLLFGSDSNFGLSMNYIDTFDLDEDNKALIDLTQAKAETTADFAISNQWVKPYISDENCTWSVEGDTATATLPITQKATAENCIFYDGQQQPLDTSNGKLTLTYDLSSEDDLLYGKNVYIFADGDRRKTLSSIVAVPGGFNDVAAQKVDAQINALGEITLDSEQAVLDARAAYEALPQSQKKFVKKLDVLESAENKLVELKNTVKLEAGSYIVPITELTSAAPIPAIADAFKKGFGRQMIVDVAENGTMTATLTPNHMTPVLGDIKYHCNILKVKSNGVEATYPEMKTELVTKSFGSAETQEIECPKTIIVDLPAYNAEKRGYGLEATVDFMNGLNGAIDQDHWMNIYLNADFSKATPNPDAVVINEAGSYTMDGKYEYVSPWIELSGLAGAMSAEVADDLSATITMEVKPIEQVFPGADPEFAHQTFDVTKVFYKDETGSYKEATVLESDENGVVKKVSFPVSKVTKVLKMKYVSTAGNYEEEAEVVLSNIQKNNPIAPDSFKVQFENAKGKIVWKLNIKGHGGIFSPIILQHFKPVTWTTDDVEGGMTMRCGGYINAKTLKNDFVWKEANPLITFTIAE